jgi:hypothetical protein
VDKIPEGRLKRVVIITIAIAAMANPIAEILIQTLRVAAKALEIFASR